MYRSLYDYVYLLVQVAFSSSQDISIHVFSPLLYRKIATKYTSLKSNPRSKNIVHINVWLTCFTLTLQELFDNFQFTNEVGLGRVQRVVSVDSRCRCWSARRDGILLSGIWELFMRGRSQWQSDRILHINVYLCKHRSTFVHNVNLIVVLVSGFVGDQMKDRNFQKTIRA